MPSTDFWEYFEFNHVIMAKVANGIQSFVNLFGDYQARNPDSAARATSPHTAAIVIGIISCLALAPVPEPSTIEVLFGYGILNFVYLGTLLMVQADYSTILEYWLLPNLTYLVTCTIITVVGRLLLSSLSTFPGPKRAALSNYWMATKLGNGTFSKTVKGLHKKYNAAVIRTGPNELSVNDAEAIVKIYGENYQRGPFYEGGKMRGATSIRETRSHYHHTIWRRIWDAAFIPTELKYYAGETDIAIFGLLKLLKKQNGEEVNCTKVIDEFALDLTAQLTFGEDAGIQDGTGDEDYVGAIKRYLQWLGFYGTMRNLVQILGYFRERKPVNDFCRKGERLLIDRQKRGASSRDITSHLLEKDEETGRKFTVPRQLAANTHLSILMGAATGTTITQTLRTLAKQKDVQKKLQSEIDAHVRSGGDLSVDSIKSLPYLNGVINEALRLHNPLPTGVHVTIPATGLDMGIYKLPAHAQVYIPVLTIMTNEKYFPQAEAFIPERWTDEKAELVADKRAFIPWGYGTHACAGKQLALNEMRATIARVVREFEIELGQTNDDKKWESKWKDYSMVTLGECMLKFKSRKV
ncbi:hypothetical protein H072_3380 [Dactylellina haptotyla CBS 200.50]|uniref:Cytochrome P450 n=1 Tax=Dactylellina haptotyla (strain CBS 200.50) TaxID=1284197 RepID=S8BT34_DACHA|nr:hypothetical protein H072_3380 [Dactylellina haptotyla CBS 200.50]